MNILNSTFINVKKLKVKTKTASFLILPISVLVLLAVVITSQIRNIRKAASVGIFDTIEDQSRLINLQKTIEQSSTGFGGGRGMMEMMNGEDMTFNEGDLYTVQAIDGVESAQLTSSIPISNIKTSDLFTDKTVTISNLSGLESEFSSIYTKDDFTYTAGEAIPIILNASTFVENYEDWQGKTEFSMDFRSMRDQFQIDDSESQDPRELMESMSPIKTKSIDYDKDSLIGQTITISFGGLDTIQDYTTERGDSGPVMKKLTDEEIQAKVDTRKTAISAYWDYDKISTPLTYTFIIVGVIEDSTTQASYVPSAFVDELMKTYFQKELDAKIVETIPSDVLNSKFIGLSYDGTNLTGSMDAMIMGGMRGGGFGVRIEGGMGRPGEEARIETTDYSESYAIPGLVIETSSDGKGTVVGEYTDTSVYTNAAKTSSTMSILVENVADRVSVIDELNDLGYAYQDLSDMEVFSELENTLNKVGNWFMVAFVVLIGGLVIITMGKFVSDGKKEIGIFRAMGMTKVMIIKLFLSQSILYAGVGLAIGLAIGILINISVAGIVNNWFTGFVESTVAESYNVVMDVESSVFRNIDWSSIGTYSLILAVVTFLTSLIPAYNASSISPVEAIRNE